MALWTNLFDDYDKNLSDIRGILDNLYRVDCKSVDVKTKGLNVFDDLDIIAAGIRGNMISLGEESVAVITNIILTSMVGSISYGLSSRQFCFEEVGLVSHIEQGDLYIDQYSANTYAMICGKDWVSKTSAGVFEIDCDKVLRVNFHMTNMTYNNASVEEEITQSRGWKPVMLS